VVDARQIAQRLQIADRHRGIERAHRRAQRRRHGIGRDRGADGGVRAAKPRDRQVAGNCANGNQTSISAALATAVTAADRRAELSSPRVSRVRPARVRE
jgi:hypothetical protein